MKQVLCAKIIFLTFLVLAFSTSSARLLRQDQDDKDVKTSNSTLHEGSFMKLQEDDIFHLMGLEECNEKDEDCASRRMVAEAHLDYIYTQHHKPKASP